MSRWIGSRRMVDESTEFDPEVDETLREYRGPGIYKHTGERIAPMQESYESHEPLRLYWVTTEEDFDNIWADGTS